MNSYVAESDADARFLGHQLSKHIDVQTVLI